MPLDTHRMIAGVYDAGGDTDSYSKPDHGGTNGLSTVEAILSTIAAASEGGVPYFCPDHINIYWNTSTASTNHLYI